MVSLSNIIGFPQIHIPSIFSPTLKPDSLLLPKILLIKLLANVDFPEPIGPLMLNIDNFEFFNPVKIFIASAVVSNIPSLIETTLIK